jgi:hypothetical protein
LPESMGWFSGIARSRSPHRIFSHAQHRPACCIWFARIEAPATDPVVRNAITLMVYSKLDDPDRKPLDFIEAAKLAEIKLDVMRRYLDRAEVRALLTCPYCNASSFVSGACGHLACDGSAELRNGRRFHKCFCGHAGFISGTRKNFQSKRLSVEAEFGSPSPTRTARQDLGSKSVDVALPPPTHGAPPAKR